MIEDAIGNEIKLRMRRKKTSKKPHKLGFSQVLGCGSDFVTSYSWDGTEHQDRVNVGTGLSVYILKTYHAILGT